MAKTRDTDALSRELGFDRKGRPFEALVNAFEVRPPDITVYNYDVSLFVPFDAI
jgi:hypothetical protein